MADEVEETDSVSVSFDLADYLPEGSLALGFIGCAKFLDAEGREQVAYLEGGFKHWERLGVLEFAHQRVDQKNAQYFASLFGPFDNATDEDEDDEDE